MPDGFDKKDFEKFYHEHIDKVYRFVFFRVGVNKQLAEDLVSEIFIKALEHFNGYDEKISRSAWIITIAKNHLANYWRDQKATSNFPENEDEGVDDFWLNSAKKVFSHNQDKAYVVSLLAKLNEFEREIVTFHYLFGYSYSEIAALKGMSETAVKVAAYRAVKKMGAKI